MSIHSSATDRLTSKGIGLDVATLHPVGGLFGESLGLQRRLWLRLFRYPT